MSGSRENSPDWLRCFKPPTETTFELSSDSVVSSPAGSPSKDDGSDSEELTLGKSSETLDDNENLGKILGESGGKSSRSRLCTPKKGQKLEDGKSPEKNKTAKKRTGGKVAGKVLKKETDDELKSSVWTLSSDSESSPQNSPTAENDKQDSDDEKISQCIGRGKKAVLGSSSDSPSKKASKDKSPKKELQVDGLTTIKEKKKSSLKKEASDDVEMKEEGAPEKQVESRVSSGRFPLILSEKVQRTKALVECEGDSIDLAGDIGAVGRVVISDAASGDPEMYLDLKGTIYKTTIVPSRTFCVVSFGQSEAKIEAIMNDFIQLKPQSNVFESETMVEGTLDGFSFDSDEEGEKVPKAQQTELGEDGEEKTNGKSKGKAEKASGVARKRGRAAGGKAQPQKKVKRKAPASKKTKGKAKK
ncbi:DNA-binding protein BIN4-like isoform X1 [Cannabis sativa]|uniref:DNA-binding protein BIN4-like isoform X1 n=1 Tax=Cannabis sativa TaxID=3483 RepID=UPI0029CA9A2C|nr:DNA-binding protein BIN4-like isoform X1 [Cannabis sativa]XP_060963531.1 DNA-binding protein BIN4-like isoform X1 [Cannabis sativa]